MTNGHKTPILLYVEETKAIRDVVIPFLRDAGFSLLLADTGTEALDILGAEKGRIDGVLTDVNLGRGPTGWNVARRARLRDARMPIIYASSAGEEEWMTNGVPLSKLVAKPFRPSQLIDVVLSVMAIPPSMVGSYYHPRSFAAARSAMPDGDRIVGAVN